jgi:uncharacterized membrane protein
MRNERNQFSLKIIQILTTAVNTFYFGLGVAMFVIGVLYLTSYFYEYTFSAFNPTIVAGIFVPFGIVIAILALFNIILLQIILCRLRQSVYYDEKNNRSTDPNRKVTFYLGIAIAISSIFILILFIVLLAIGIWGLSVYSNNSSLTNEVRNNFLDAEMNYDMSGGNNNHNKAIDWVQKTFECCGISIFHGNKINVKLNLF